MVKSTNEFIKSEFKGVQISENKNGKEGVDFIITSNNGVIHNLFVQSIDLDKERSVKIPKQNLGELSDTLWVCLVLEMDGTAQGLYLIPSKILAVLSSSIFINNESRFAHLSNWEIKVFTNGMAELSKYSIKNMLKKV